MDELNDHLQRKPLHICVVEEALLIKLCLLVKESIDCTIHSKNIPHVIWHLFDHSSLLQNSTQSHRVHPSIYSRSSVGLLGTGTQPNILPIEKRHNHFWRAIESCLDVLRASYLGWSLRDWGNELTFHLLPITARTYRCRQTDQSESFVDNVE